MPLTTLKIAVVAPRAMASIDTARIVKPRWRAMPRRPKCRSRRRSFIIISSGLRERESARGQLLLRFAFVRLFDHASVKKMDGAIGVSRETRIVRDHADGGAGAVQVTQE